MASKRLIMRPQRHSLVMIFRLDRLGSEVVLFVPTTSSIQIMAKGIFSIA